MAVVLVLKRLRRRSNGLKSHPTDWEKPGIEPATPGLNKKFNKRCLLHSPAQNWSINIVESYKFEVVRSRGFISNYQ